MSIVNRVVAGLATAALCASLAACSNASAGGDVASVNGTKITRSDFDKKLEAGPAGKQTLTQLVQQTLVDQYAADKKIEISADDIAKREADIKGKYPPGQFEQILKQQGLTEDDVKNILRQQIILEKAVGPNVKVSDADIKAYFDKNHVALDKPAQVRARHILVADQKTANDIEAKLKGGAKFEDLAKQFSTDPSTKDKGGELGFFGKGQMVPAFQDAAFNSPVGKITAPVKSPFGYHIIQVEEKKPAFKATLSSAHDQIRDTLKQQQQAQQLPVFLQGLKANAKIEVYDDRLKDAFPPAAAAPAPAAASAAPAAPPTK
ncbi:MAG: posttranslocation chaperone PrsA2 [Candidatus Velthaea sp.]